MTHPNKPTYQELERRLHEAEVALETMRQLARFQTITDQAVHGTAMSDLDGNILYINDAFARAHGYAPEELLGRNLAVFHSEEQLAEVARLNRELMSSGRFGPSTVWHTHRDGTPFPMLMSGILIRDARGEPDYMAATAIDIAAQVRAQQAVAESEKKFATFFHHGPLPMAISTVEEGRYLDVNDAFVAQLGYGRDQLLGKTSVELGLIRADDRQRLARCLQEEGHVSGMELPLVAADGSAQITRYFCEPIELEGQTRLLSVAQDVTEGVRAQHALRASEQRFARAFHAAPVLMTISALDDGRYLEVNDTFCQATGYTREVALGATSVAIGFISEDDRRQLAETLRRDGRVSDLELELRRADGSRMWCLYSGELIEVEGETRLLSIAVDISGRKAAEEALRDVAERLDTLVQSSPIAIVALNMEGRVTLWNPAAEQLFGWTEDEVLGLLNPLLPPEEIPGYPQRLEAQSRGEEGRVELFRRTKAGDARCVWLSTAPLHDRHGEAIGVMGLLEDVTELREAERQRESLQDQLLQAQKLEAIGRLAGGVAHDFNNMLAVILGHAQMARDGLPRNEPLYQELGEIIVAGRRAADLTNHLLAFARRQTVAPQVIDLNENLSERRDSLSRLMGDQIALTLQPQEGLWPIYVDPGQLSHVLGALCTNAREAIDGAGSVTIATGHVTVEAALGGQQDGCEPGDYVQLLVRDDGRGMDAETLSHLFEPFYTTKPFGERDGLGLATLYGIVRQNRGYVQVESAPGQGSTFRVGFPRHLITASSPDPADDAARPTVLLVEHEPALLAMSERMLERLGCRVLAARSPREAIRLARQSGGESVGAIRLLMADMMMPEMGLPAFVAAVRQACPGIACLVTTGYGEAVARQESGLDAGTVFLCKPYTRAQLKAKLRQMLGQP